MVTIEKILVPVDFSECAWAALSHAASWAIRWGAELHFLHVCRIPWYVDPYTTIRSGGRHHTLEVVGRIKAEAEMARFVHVLEDYRDLALRSSVKPGTPRNVILEISELKDFDLIVMGTHGRTGLPQLFLGSTAEGVVRRAPCPVLTVSNKINGASNHMSGGDEVGLKRILVPVDLCDCSLAALQYAVDLGKVTNASIEVLHVVEVPQFEPPPMPGHIGKHGMTLSQYAVNEAANRLAAMLGSLREREPAFSFRVVTGYPKDVILAELNASQHDVVVVGTHGRKGISHFFLGSVAEQIVRHAPCPVMTIRTPVHD